MTYMTLDQDILASIINESTLKLSLQVYSIIHSFSLIDSYNPLININYNSISTIINFNSVHCTTNLYNYSIDFAYYNFINRPAITFKYYSTTLFVPHVHTFIPMTGIDPYLKYKVILKIVYSVITPLLDFLHIWYSLIVYFFIYMEGIMLFLLFLLYINRIISNKFIFTFFFFWLIRSVDCFYNHELHTGFTIMDSLGLLLYVLLIALYDYLVLRNTIRLNSIFNNFTYNFIFSGFLYLLAISVGIFFTNSLWYSTQTYNTNDEGLWYIVSSIVSIISAAIWILFKNIIINNINESDFLLSFLRSIFEIISFAGISWSTYCSWDFVYSFNIPYLNIIASVLGFILHIFFSLFVIYIETMEVITGNLSMIYGLLYFFSWSTVVFSTNGILGIVTPYLNDFIRQFITTIICSIITILLQPNFYRISRPNATNFFVHVIINFFLILSYVLVNYLLFQPFV